MRRICQPWLLVGPLALLAVATSGCVGVKVRYIVEPKHDEAGLIKFRLPGSMVTLAPRDSDSKSKTGFVLDRRTTTSRTANSRESDFFADVGGLVTPVAASEQFALVVHDPFWQKTTASHSYLDASGTVLKELGTQVTDYRKQIIETAAPVAKFAAIGILGGPPPARKDMLILPVAIEIMPAVIDGEWRALPGNEWVWWYRAEIAPPDERVKLIGSPRVTDNQDSSITAAHFFHKFRNDGGESTGVFPVASCRTVVLSLRRSTGQPKKGSQPDPKTGEQVQLRFTVADPRAIDTTAIPAKGAVKMKGVCGADVSSEPAGDASVWALLEEVATQAKAIRDSQTTGKSAK